MRNTGEPSGGKHDIDPKYTLNKVEAYLFDKKSDLDIMKTQFDKEESSMAPFKSYYNLLTE